MNIRTACVDTDLPGIIRVLNACDPDHPTSLDSLRSNFLDTTPGRIQRRLVVMDEKEAVTGYSVTVHVAEAPEHHFYVWLGVQPSQRGQGLGSALWNLSLVYLQEQGATRVSSEVLDTDPASLGFAERRGFKIDRQHFYSVLDLATFDETPYLPDIAALEEQNIRFCSLANFPDTPETRRKFYELNLAVVMDIPGEDWNFENYPGFFEKRILGSPRFKREGQLLAVDGDALVGFAAVSLFSESQSAYNATTGVIRAYRGRGIALALKVLSARYARQHGEQTLRTDNDSLNAPILAINRRMGYQPQPGTYQLVRWLGGIEQQ
jgi:ribosomal protein S18 acetylase RimI-like enzyme